MASILDQYELASSGQLDLNPFLGQESGQPISTGYIDVRSSDDVPIFKRNRINFRPPSNIVDLVVNNNMVVVGLSSNALIRIDLANTSEIDKIEPTKRLDDSIHKLFLDPTAKHLIVCMKSQESFYIARNSSKAKPLSKFRGHLIEAVAWNKTKMTDTSTQTILLGTNKGLIFQTEIEPEERVLFPSGPERFFKQLYNVNAGGDSEEPICGMFFEKFPTEPKAENRYFIMVSTQSRLYHFTGDVVPSEQLDFQPLFVEYENSPAPFIEMPKSHVGELRLFYPKPRGVPSSFAWLTGGGIYYGQLDLDPKKHENTVDAKLLMYQAHNSKDMAPTALSIAITGFHVLILYKDKFEAVSLLNEKPVFEDDLPPRYGALRGIVTDIYKKTIWAFTDNSIFEYEVKRESRDVWKMYLEKGEFELAKEYCKDNPANLDKVFTSQAEDLFEKKNFAQAATCYAQTQVSFEEVALKFIQLQEKQALKMFLLKKCQSLKSTDKTQTTMIVIWLLELYLNQLGEVRESADDIREGMQDEFRKFLASTKVKTCLRENPKVAYDILASHGDVENLVFFATLMQDYEHVLNHHLQHDDFLAALDVITKQTDTHLFYKFSPVLMQRIPKQTVSAWIDQKKRLDPRKLIPSLVHYQHGKSEQTRQSIRYLEYCIELLGNKDEAIHNYLLSLYTEIEDDDSLLRYILMQGQDPDQVHYDMKYALRLCAENNKFKACVHIYSTMGLFEEAVDLALKVDVDLAKAQAEKPPEEEEVLRKKLWLRIARHVVENEKDVKKAMEFLSHCSLLKIEDILPFFQDFVTIDHFKDAICSSLQDYNEHIQLLKSDMHEATQSAECIRTDIHHTRNKFSIVPAQEKCCICSYPLLTRQFYVFPCNHVFHMDCLVTELMPQLKEKQKNKLAELKQLLHSPAVSGTPSDTASSSSRLSPESLKAEIGDIVASECIYCGELMIRGIDKPFIAADEYEDAIKSWK
mgnify:CR=1 FL=1